MPAPRGVCLTIGLKDDCVDLNTLPLELTCRVAPLVLVPHQGCSPNPKKGYKVLNSTGQGGLDLRIALGNHNANLLSSVQKPQAKLSGLSQNVNFMCTMTTTLCMIFHHLHLPTQNDMYIEQGRAAQTHQKGPYR